MVPYRTYNLVLPFLFLPASPDLCGCAPRVLLEEILNKVEEEGVEGQVAASRRHRAHNE